jgi:hypothetical protein
VGVARPRPADRCPCRHCVGSGRQPGLTRRELRLSGLTSR